MWAATLKDSPGYLIPNYISYSSYPFLTREYTKHNKWVIGMDSKFTHMLDPSLSFNCFSHIYVEILGRAMAR